MSFSFLNLYIDSAQKNEMQLPNNIGISPGVFESISPLEEYHYYQSFCKNFEKILTIFADNFYIKFYDCLDNFQTENKEYAILIKTSYLQIAEDLLVFKKIISFFFSNSFEVNAKFKKALLQVYRLSLKLQKHIYATGAEGKIEVIFKLRVSPEEYKVSMDWFNLNLMKKCSLEVYHYNSYYYNFSIEELSQNNKFINVYSKKLHLGSTTLMEFKRAFVEFANQFYLLQCP